jgi:cyclophilin family peptidyl-prolyl cis-trans isomerase
MLLTLTVAVVSLAGQPHATYAQDGQTPDELCDAADIQEPANRDFSQPDQVLEDGIDYRAIFCTEIGAIYVDLLEDLAPITVNNFVFLAENGFYNNTTFHRVLADFMIQGGDPLGTGTGGPGYSFQDEFVSYMGFSRPGLLAMANSGPNTNGSQFFITRVPTPHLNGRHTIFGRVIDGQTVVDEMPNRDPQNPEDVASPGTTLETILIVTAEDNIDAPELDLPTFTPEEIQQEMDFVPVEGFEAVDDATGAETREFEDYGSVTAAQALWELSECPEEPDLLALGLRVIDWEDAETAAEVQADTDFVAAELAPELEAFDGDGGEGLIFTTDTSACDLDATLVRYIWNRDRYTLSMDFVIADGIVPPENYPQVATNISLFFERAIGEAIFRAVYND